MYRYIVDNTIMYTPDDLVLFRESPFAVWMERLTVENPEHGIPPDLDSIASYHQPSRPNNDIVATLRVEGRNVVLIDPAKEEPARRAATLEAMRHGADFIVSGQLALGSLSGAVDLLMRTSGFSELGDFLYIPCDTHADSSLQSSFRLCFSADLLAGLQGQLPPQMLIIRDGAEVVPLQTEDHIYYYRAVLKRFLNAMGEFRKHRMPDPAESAHFGRWAECAGEVLKQRACSEQQGDEPQRAEQQHEKQSSAALVEEIPQLRVASGAGVGAQYNMDVPSRPEFAAANHVLHSNLLESSVSDRSESSPTLAEQACLLKPGSYRNGTPPGHTPSLARIGKPRIVTAATQEHPHSPPAPSLSGDALADPDRIAVTQAKSTGAIMPEVAHGEAIRPAPAPNLRDTSQREKQAAVKLKVGVVHLPEFEPRPPVFLPPDPELVVSPPREQLNTRVRDDEEFESGSSSVVDLDSAPASNLAPVVQRAEAVFKRLLRDDPVFKKAEAATSRLARDENDASARSFSSSLQTSEEFNDT